MQYGEHGTTKQPLVTKLGIKLRTDTLSLTSEDEEPLLLLPDYVAGIAHAKHSRANTMAKSAVTPLDAERAYLRLSDAVGYVECVGPFEFHYHDIFPDFAVPTEVRRAQ